MNRYRVRVQNYWVAEVIVEIDANNDREAREVALAHGQPTCGTITKNRTTILDSKPNTVGRYAGPTGKRECPNHPGRECENTKPKGAAT